MTRNYQVLITIVAGLMMLLVACGQDNSAEQPETVQIVQTVDQDAIMNAVVATVEAQTAERRAQEAATATAEAEPLQVASELPDITSSMAGMDLSLQNALTTLYDEVNPSVVFILVATNVSGGSGSGFVFDSDGHIVTNNHVVEGAVDMEVVFSDGSRRDAEVVGTDTDSDLAVIKVESLPEGVQPVRLSDMSQVDVGQFAVAIGNPFGEQGSMSLGIISGLGRSLTSQRDTPSTSGSYQLPQVIQTDAPINPGNSGGPLLNIAGEVIGVNSAIRTTSGQNSGVGFAIPINAVRTIIPPLIENGAYTYPYMGVGFASEGTTAAVIDQLGYGDIQGAYVGSLVAGGPAALSGLQPANAGGLGGDLIIAIDGQPITNFDDLNSYLVFNTRVGQTIEMTVIRDGAETVVPLTLGARP